MLDLPLGIYDALLAKVLRHMDRMIFVLQHFVSF